MFRKFGGAFLTLAISLTAIQGCGSDTKDPQGSTTNETTVTQLTVSPSNTEITSGMALSSPLTVEFRNANNNLVTSATGTVLATTANNATLDGRTTVTATNGRAHFSDLVIHGVVGETYTITFTAGTLNTSVDVTVTDCVFDGRLATPEAPTRTSLGPIAMGGLGTAKGHSIVLAPCGALATGANDQGQLGTGNLDAAERFTPLATQPPFVKLAANENSGVGLASNGDVYTWGTGASLGYVGSDACGNATGLACETTPSRVDLGAALTIVDADVGLDHTVVITEGGAGLAWGRNSFAQAGDTHGDLSTSLTPHIMWSNLNVTSVAAGFYHTLVLTEDGAVFTWGASRYGELGYPTDQTCVQDLPCSDTPKPVQFPSEVDVVAIAAGDAHSLAATAADEVWTWGDNSNGELGIGSSGSSSETPQRVLTGVDVISMAAGSFHNLVLASDGRLFAWGSNSNGQLGDGTTTRVTSPKLVARTNFVHVEAAGSLSHAYTEDGELYVWGEATSNLGMPWDRRLLEPTRWGEP